VKCAAIYRFNYRCVPIAEVGGCGGAWHWLSLRSPLIDAELTSFRRTGVGMCGPDLFVVVPRNQSLGLQTSAALSEAYAAK